MTPFLRIIHREIGYEPETWNGERLFFSRLFKYIFQSGLNFLNDLNLLLDVGLSRMNANYYSFDYFL